MVGSEVTVVHVDDSPGFAELSAKFLEREHDELTVIHETSTQVALSFLDREDVDCIVSDYEMPEMDGLEFLDAVRATEPDLPFILFTGKGSEEIASEAITAGVTDYLQKEVGSDQYAVLGNRIINAVSQYRTERELREQREFTESALDVLNDVFFVLGTDGKLLRWNSQVKVVTGYTDEELESMYATDFVRDEDANRAVAAIAEVFETGSATLNADYVTKDGDGIPHEFRGARLTDANGEVTRLCGIARDVSDRNARERKLEEYATMIETVPDGMFLLDGGGEMVRVNDAWADIVGNDPEELVGTPFMDLVERGIIDEGVTEQYTDVVAGLSSADSARHKAMLTMNVVPANDTVEHVYELHLALLPYDEGCQGVVGVVRDVTETKRHEAELRRQNERLERFASITSHDLRSPLNVALGNLELFREEYGGENEYLDVTTNALERMDDIIRDVLTLARNGNSIITMKHVTLSEVIRRAWQSVDTAEATLHLGTDGSFEADANRLQQLFENLIRNAVGHAGSAAVITVNAVDDGFVFADDGPGISPNRRESVFKSGYTTTTNGTGFGLAIVEQIVQAHGWEIEVTDGEAGGARFEITGVDVVR